MPAARRSYQVDIMSALSGVFDSVDLLSVILEYLSARELVSVQSVQRSWLELIRDADPSSSCNIASSATGAVRSGESSTTAATDPNAAVTDASTQVDAFLSRYSLPDAIYPVSVRGVASPVRSMPSPLDSTVPPSPPPLLSPSPELESNSAMPVLSLLQQQTALELDGLPSSLSECQAFFRALAHPCSPLRAIRLSGVAEKLAFPPILSCLHTHTLHRLEELQSCSCLVGQYLLDEDEIRAKNSPSMRTNYAFLQTGGGALETALRRWSRTPLDHSPEHASQHLLNLEQVTRLVAICPNLRILNLANAKLWDNSLTIIGAHLHHTLESLNLNFNLDITNTGLAALQSCFKLREVQFQRCWKLTPQGFEQFVRALAQGVEKESKQQLQQQQQPETETPQIALSANAVAAPLPCRLRLVNFNENRQKGHDCLMAILDYCPMLEHVELCELNLSADHLQSLAQKCPRLKYVNLSRCGATAALSPGGAGGLAQQPQRQALRMQPDTSASAGASAIHSTSSTFPPFSHVNSLALADRIPPAASATATANPSIAFPPRPVFALEHAPVGVSPFHLSFDFRITDVSLSYLSTNCRYIAKLNLDRSNITNHGLKFLSQYYLPHLQHLSLWQCDEIGDEGLRKFLSFDPTSPTPTSPPVVAITSSIASLQKNTSLNFILLPQNPSLISSDAIQLLIDHCPNLQHLLGYVPVSTSGQLDNLLKSLGVSLRSLSLNTDEKRLRKRPPMSAMSSMAPPSTPGASATPSRPLSSVGLRTLTELKSLVCLDLTSSLLQDEDFLFIIYHLSYLTTLKLNSCKNLSDVAFRWEQMRAFQKHKPAVSNSDAAPSSNATGAPAVKARSMYFDAASVDWSCRLELVYLSQLSSQVTSRTVQSIAELRSVRYLDCNQCVGVSQEEDKVQRLQAEWTEQQQCKQRLPLTVAVV